MNWLLYYSHHWPTTSDLTRCTEWQDGALPRSHLKAVFAAPFALSLPRDWNRIHDAWYHPSTTVPHPFGCERVHTCCAINCAISAICRFSTQFCIWGSLLCFPYFHKSPTRPVYFELIIPSLAFFIMRLTLSRIIAQILASRLLKRVRNPKRRLTFLTCFYVVVYWYYRGYRGYKCVDEQKLIVFKEMGEFLSKLWVKSSERIYFGYERNGFQASANSSLSRSIHSHLLYNWKKDPRRPQIPLRRIHSHLSC